jgi:hypothetical protein
VAIEATAEAVEAEDGVLVVASVEAVEAEDGVMVVASGEALPAGCRGGRRRELGDPARDLHDGGRFDVP